MAPQGNTGLLYSLCAIAAIGVLLNVILVFWQLFTYTFERGFRFVKGALILLDIFYVLTGLAVIFLLVYEDVGVQFLCKAGGFLVLFATQEAVWILATSCVSLLLWKRRSLSKDFQRRSVTIFLLIVCAQSLVLLIVSVLPFTRLQYFDSRSEYYFLCAPFRLPGEQGWAFSTLVIILDWIALGVSVVTLAVVSVRYSTCNDPELSPADKLTESRSNKRQVQRQLFLSLVTGSAGWGTVLVLVSVSYFSNGRLDKGTVQWILGFCISATIIVHVLSFFFHSLFSKWVLPRLNQDPSGLQDLVAACPKAIENAQRQTGGQQDPGIVCFLVRWRDAHGRLLPGSMKVFSPNMHDKWRNEVNAVARIGALGHPNVAPYLWLTPNNSFASFLQSSTRHVVSQKSLVLCRLHYPSGTLQNFLQSRIHQLTEIGLHKITLDVATGLEYIHQHHLVHNGLTTHTVYMASVSEKIGLKAVIGDLESCYEVPQLDAQPSGHTNHVTKPQSSPASQMPDLFAITGRVNMGAQIVNNRFAPDIRSFGMVVLEMLVAMTEYNQKRKLRMKTLSRAPGDVRLSTESVQSVDDVTSQATSEEHCCVPAEPDSIDADREMAVDVNPHHHHHDNDHPCSCSSNVTDVRARKGRSKNKKSFQLDISNHYQIHKKGVDSDHVTEYTSNHPRLDENAQCADCGKFQKSAEVSDNVTYMNQAMPGLRYRARPWELLHKDMGDALNEMNVSQESVSLGADSEYSPRSDGTSESSTDSTHRQRGVPNHASDNSYSVQEGARKGNRLLTFLPFQRPNPVLEVPESSGSDTDTSLDRKPSSNDGPPRASPRRGTHKQILTNGSFLATPRSTPEIRPPSRPRKADACTDTADFGEFDSNESLRSVGLESLPEATTDLDPVEDTKNGADPLIVKPLYVGGFQTIYEEDEGLKSQTDSTATSNRKLQIQRVPLVKRKLPTAQGAEGNGHALAAAAMAEANRRKRNSMASLDGSIISADSGVGSSCHYDNLSVSDQSSVYFTNMPGTRDTVYMTDSIASAGDGYGPLKTFLTRGRHGHRHPDSGIDSNGDSCDDLVSGTAGRSEGTENVYEVMPDPSEKGVRKKKPCVGHHEGVGHTCCTLDNQTLKHQAIEEACVGDRVHGKLSPSHQVGAKGEGERKDYLEAQWKQLVDTATNTSDQDDSSHEGDQDTKDVAQDNPSSRRPPVTQPTPPMFTKLEAALLDELLDLRQQNSASRASLARSTDTGHGHPHSASQHQEALYQDNGAHCNNCKRMYKRQCESSSSSYYPPARADVHRRRTNSSMKMSSSSSSPSSFYKNSISSFDGISMASTSNLSDPLTLNSSGEAVPGPSTASKAGMGHRQVAQFHAAMRTGSILPSDDGRHMQLMLEAMRRQGKLGFVAGQLVPLLTECWSEDPVPSADDILQRLCEVLPTAAV